MKRLLLILLTLLAVACSGSTGGGAERWPDLPEPLSPPYVMVLNGELTLFGGHTDGFVLSPSAWYLKGGAWHEAPMKYSHDFAFCTLLPDGRVMLGGGSAEAFGIGQSWGVEIYDPATHTFSAEGILDRKRTGASALALPDGKVLVSGNWYAPDAMEIYEPGKGFSFLKEVTVERATPFILASAPDNAVVFSGLDNYGKPSDGTVDRLQGDPFHEPLLDEWEPWGAQRAGLSIGEYAYLVLARHRESGEWGILRITGEHFSLLETDQTLPARSEAGGYIWSQLAVDRSRRSAYTLGVDTEGNACVARINYDPIFDGAPAEVTLTEFPGPFPLADTFALLPDGTLVLAGGTRFSSVGGFPSGDNFKTVREVWAFPTGAASKADFPWGWVLGAGLLLLALLALLANLHHRRKAAPQAPKPTESDAGIRKDLMEQMSALIEDQQLFRRKNLRITDVADELATNKTYVSALLNNLSGEKFTSMITRLRVEYAQHLMREHPDMLLDDVADESGFSSRTTFFRSFKALTGTTPQEWKTKA